MIKDRTNSKKEVMWFFITTFLLSWMFWLPALLIQNYNIAFPLSYDFFITSGIFVPSVLGIIFTFLTEGKKGLHLLFKSLLNFRIGFKWWLFVFLVLPSISMISCLLFSLFKGTLPQMQFPLLFIPVAFVYILVFMGPLGEEIGWRGFALQKMLLTLSPIRSALTLGLVWSTWHFPLFFINNTTQNALTDYGIVLAIAGYYIHTIMISILLTILFIKSAGSVLGSVLLHTVANMSLGIFPIILTQNGALITLVVLCIVTSAFVIRYRENMFINK